MHTWSRDWASCVPISGLLDGDGGQRDTWIYYTNVNDYGLLSIQSATFDVCVRARIMVSKRDTTAGGQRSRAVSPRWIEYKYIQIIACVEFGLLEIDLVPTTMSGTWRHRAYLTVLVSIWYLFSYLFNSSLKEWFRVTEDHACTLFPLLLAIFLSNAVAAGAWVLHGAGCLTSPRAAMSGLGWVAQMLTDGLRVESTLLCGSGAVGIAASCIVLQHGSIQLVQVSGMIPNHQSNASDLYVEQMYSTHYSDVWGS